MKAFKLSDTIQVKSRFGRSVNLERDFYQDSSLEGYVFTVTARQGLQRFCNALSESNSAKAWTLTGPFGSGKSTFALYTAKVFDFRFSKDSKTARQLLFERDADLWSQLFEGGRRIFDEKTAPNFFPILVSGTREPIAKAILRGIETALISLGSDQVSKCIKKTRSLSKSDHVVGRQIIQLLSEITDAITLEERKVGVLLIIDELGKLLEFVASSPESSDVFLLQELAEATKNSTFQFHLITVLHQAFERYAERLGKRERDEWTKVQGRFDDIPFLEPNEQTLHVITSAFEKTVNKGQNDVFERVGGNLAETAFNLGITGTLSREVSFELLQGCLPLHPTVALTLGPLFRRFGQNERSLFAFLASNESEFGFPAFLRSTEWSVSNADVVRLDRIYDYLVSAIGSALYAGPEGRKWAEIESILDRVSDATDLEIRLIKTIGLLRLVGDQGRLKSSDEVLRFALAYDRNTTKNVDSALMELCKKSAIVKRNFNNTYAIWEGSDIDLEERFREAEKRNDQNISLVKSLNLDFPSRPIVAKRHSYQTGTLRFFETVYTDATNFEEICQAELTQGDGRIVFAVFNDLDDQIKFKNSILNGDISLHPRTLVAIPRNLERVNEAAKATQLWRWVKENTPNLESDRAARSELQIHLSHSASFVKDWLSKIEGGGSQSDCFWFWNNKEIQLRDRRSLQELVSNICDEVFSKTPILRNELINRRYLSSAASAARRRLLEAMLVKGDEPNLAIVGFPPEMSMYISMLRETTIHREHAGSYGFFPPDESAERNIRSVWSKMEDFLAETDTTRLTVADLFKILKAPPFGLTDGVLPILFCAILVSYDADLALYERGTFVPIASPPVFERLCRTPEAFTLQLCRVDGIREQLIEKLAETITPGKSGVGRKKLDILSLVRPLSVFANGLSSFSLQTARISPEAQAVRQALVSAREPNTLLFKDLPEALGLLGFLGDDSFDEGRVADFCKQLHNSLAELGRAENVLLQEIEDTISSAFEIGKTGEDLRDGLNEKCRLVAEYAVSAKLKSFILRVSDLEIDFRSWVESLGALLGGKPIAMWQDEDLSRFELAAAELVRSFTSLESLVFALNMRGASEESVNADLLRLSLTRLGESELEKIIHLDNENKVLMDKIIGVLDSSFRELGLDGNVESRLSILAQLSLRILQESNDSGVVDLPGIKAEAAAATSQGNETR